MFLNINDFDRPGKIVYQLSLEHAADPEGVAETQATTLDASKPYLGLSGAHGLYGSEDWWTNIRNGVIPIRSVSGVITSMYRAGMEPDELESMDFEYVDDDGIVRNSSCYANNVADIGLYQVGKKVWFVYALDLLKQQPLSDGDINYAEILLEAAIST